MPRFITGRNTEPDKATCLAVIPVATGETLSQIYVTGHAVTRGTGFGGIVGSSSSYQDQPGEINWYGIYVPWTIASTYNAATPQGAPDAVLDSADDWDRLFKLLMFEWESDGNEYYGGDADADKLPASGQQPSKDDGTGVAEDELSQRTEPVGPGAPGTDSSKGPVGISRFFSREVYMLPFGSDGDGKTRFGDQLGELTLPVNRSGPGFALLGVVRYTIAAETNFNWEVATNNQARVYGRQIFVGGDLTRMQRYIEKDTGDTGDWLRTMMFGGDSFIEADTIKELPAKSFVKGVATIQTPYSLIRF